MKYKMKHTLKNNFILKTHDMSQNKTKLWKCNISTLFQSHHQNDSVWWWLWNKVLGFCTMKYTMGLWALASLSVKCTWLSSCVLDPIKHCCLCFKYNYKNYYYRKFTFTKVSNKVNGLNPGVSVNVREGGSSRLVKSWERLLMPWW